MRNIIGQKFNRLVVTEDYATFYGGRKRRMTKCICECGTEVVTTKTSIINGHTKSCGCIKLKFTEREKTKAIRSSYSSMRNRCHDVDGKWFKYYKAKGITYCERWGSFKNFYDDMHETWKPGLELDRIKNEVGYYKENCRWNTKTGQQRNKTSNKLTESIVIAIRGSKKSTKELAEKYNVHVATITRIKQGKRWSL